MNRGLATSTATEIAFATTATAAAAATETAATTTTTAAAEAAGFRRTGLIDRQGAALEIFSVERFNGCLGAFGVSHRDKGKAARARGNAVEDDMHFADGPVLCKQILEIGFCDLERKVPDI